MDPITAETGRRPWRYLLVPLLLLLLCATLGVGFHAFAVYDRGIEVGAAARTAGPAPAGDLTQLAPGLFHVRIAGEGYPLGYQHGSLLRAELNEVVRYLEQEIVGSRLARDVLLYRAWQLDRRTPPRYRQEMRGIADGAGIEYAEVLLINTYDDLMHLLRCSSAVLLPQGGEPLRHARNLDYPLPELARHKVVFDLSTRGTVQSAIMEPRSGRLWLARGTQVPVTRGGYAELGPAWGP